jgi:hypothetical protein
MGRAGAAAYIVMEMGSCLTQMVTKNDVFTANIQKMVMDNR